ncbi:hypothetical protein [Agromyces badenianii]|uniref:hypothetical protein n=1 Tax=Agromyces badenianii TaxID=2080742 RepID=UPI00105A65F5|nr:hypothetical protein [Agromyces badenianii]
MIISEEVSEELAVEAGSTLVVDGDNARVSEVYKYPVDGRRAELEYAVLLPTIDTSHFDQCWAATWPVPDNIASLVRTAIAVDAASDSQVDIGQLNSALGPSFDGEELLRGRITSAAPLVALGGTFVIAAGGVIRRRTELASALHAGVRRVDLLAQLLVESCLTLIIGASVAVAVATAATADRNAADATSVLQSSAIILVGGLVGYLVGCLITSVTCVREAGLFRYFKEK